MPRLRGGSLHKRLSARDGCYRTGSMCARERRLPRERETERVYGGTGVLNGNARPGMRVMFVAEMRTPTFKVVRAFESARLVRALEEYPVPSPEDRFEVDFRGERLVVQRKDIAVPFNT